MITTKVGHVHLKVRDLERAVAFYTGLLDMEVTEQVRGRYAFLSAGQMHHDVALQAVSPQAPSPSPYGVGLYHTAFEVPDRAQLAEILRRLQASGVEYVAVDHGISWAIYFDDPDGNGVEVYLDRRGTPEGTGEWSGRSYPLSAEQISGA